MSIPLVTNVRISRTTKFHSKAAQRGMLSKAPSLIADTLFHLFVFGMNEGFQDQQRKNE
jgi:hypothetical protein